MVGGVGGGLGESGESYRVCVAESAVARGLFSGVVANVPITCKCTRFPEYCGQGVRLYTDTPGKRIAPQK